MQINELKQYIARSIRKSLPIEEEFEQVEIVLVPPPENIDADFAFGCFPLARKLRRSPSKIAQDIANTITCPSWIESATPAGPYLNIKLKTEYMFRIVTDQVFSQQNHFGKQRVSDPDTILVEYSSPNTNKPLHLGHVRNNVLGMAIVNLLDAMGHTVIPASIMNDRGIHICKAMVAYSLFAGGKTPADFGMKGDHFVGWNYVQFEKAVKNDPSLMDKAREMLRDWEDGRPDVIELWKKLNRWVYEGFNETYQRLGSRFELVQYESQTYQLGKKVIEEGLSKGVFTKDTDGSVWIDLTDVNLDKKTLLRADGTSLYVTQDLGVAVERFNSRQLDRVIYIVGSEQIYHFKVLFEIFRRMGYPWADHCIHLSYGMVYLPEGKMKSREGKVVDADDLMDRMKKLALDIMVTSHIQIDPEKRSAVAEKVAIGAIKYYILKFNTQKDIHFDPEKSLSLEGASGAYLQYTYARIRSLLRKQPLDLSITFQWSNLIQPEEINLARKLLHFPQIVRSCARELNPCKLATYLWELAKSFNVFYTKYRILDVQPDSLSQARLALAAAIGFALKSGMSLLGIPTPEKM